MSIKTKLSKNAILDWEQVKTPEDVFKWHKLYTPWFSDEYIKELVKIYDAKLQNPKPEDIYIKEKFELMFLKSI